MPLNARFGACRYAPLQNVARLNNPLTNIIVAVSHHLGPV